MIEETQLTEGEVFPLSKSVQYLVTYLRFEDGLWKMLTPHICAFLNTRGGRFVVGVQSDCRITGVDISPDDVDNIGLRFDNHINGISPQVDARTVGCTFFKLKPKAEAGKDRYVVVFEVKPGTKPLYYTSYLFKQTFTMSQMGPRTLNREEIRQRNLNSREFCLQLEDFTQNTNIFIDNISKIERFITGQPNYAEQINIIQVFGNAGSGRSSLVNQALEHYFSDYQIIQVDFERILHFEDYYISILKQLDQNVTKLNQKDLDTLSDEHKTIKKPWEEDVDDSNFIFPSAMMNMATPKYYRLFNIFNNSVYDYYKMGKKLVLAFFNVNQLVLELIPTYPCTVFLTTSQNLALQTNVRSKIISLKSKRLTVEQLKAYFSIKQYDIPDWCYERILQYTCGNFPKILKLVQEHQSDMAEFLQQFQGFSLRKQKAYFNDGSFQVPTALIKPLACLSTFPDVFTFEMMEGLLRAISEKTVAGGGAPSAAQEQELSQLINSLQPFLFRSKGKYFIAPAMRSYVLQQVDSDFGVNICRKMIDAMLDELAMINVQYERMQSVKQELSDGFSKTDSAYMLQVCAMYVNEWICDFGSTLDVCVDICISFKYKMEQMLQLLNVFAGLKISADKMKLLKRTVRGMVPKGPDEGTSTKDDTATCEE